MQKDVYAVYAYSLICVEYVCSIVQFKFYKYW
jgi:hypothetical protein